MKTQNPNLNSDGLTDRQTDGQAKSNMPLPFFQSWGHKNYRGLKGKGVRAKYCLHVTYFISFDKTHDL